MIKVLSALIIGILGSAIVTLLVEYWKYRKNRFHVDLKLGPSEFYSSKEKSDIGIKVVYKSQDVKTSLVILRASLINDGRFDIMFSSHFSEEIEMICPGYRIVSVSFHESPSKPVGMVTKDGHLSFSWDILKKGEVIRMEIAAIRDEENKRYPSNIESIFNSLHFKFRSDCIDSIKPKRVYSLSDRVTMSSWKRLVFLSLFLLVASFMAIILICSILPRYSICLQDNHTYNNTALFYIPFADKYLIAPLGPEKSFITSVDNVKTTSLISPEKDAEYYTMSFMGVILCVLAALTLVLIIKIVSRMRQSKLRIRREYNQ